jgi:hypothetical protein
MGHLGLRALGHVSLSEAMGTGHFVLCQVQDVLQWERDDIEEEQQCLMDWGSLQKKWTTFEKQKVVAKRAQLSEMEDLLNKELVAIGLLEAEAQKLMEDAKELYADATIKLQEDLNGHMIAIAQ